SKSESTAESAAGAPQLSGLAAGQYQGIAELACNVVQCSKECYTARVIVRHNVDAQRTTRSPDHIAAEADRTGKDHRLSIPECNIGIGHANGIGQRDGSAGLQRTAKQCQCSGAERAVDARRNS